MNPNRNVFTILQNTNPFLSIVIKIYKSPGIHKFTDTIVSGFPEPFDLNAKSCRRQRPDKFSFTLKCILVKTYPLRKELNIELLICHSDSFTRHRDVGL